MQARSLSQCLYCGTATEGQDYCCRGCETLGKSFGVNSRAVPESNSYLDLENFKTQYHHDSGAYDYALYVEGIHCTNCVNTLEKLPNYDPQIERATVSFGESKLFLKVRASFSLAELTNHLANLGYRAHYLKPFEPSLGIQDRENKVHLKKLAVAGACAGNIMLFVIPIYAGLEGSWKIAFNWMSFLLFLPILFYSATDFYQGAYQSLKTRSLNIDLPIVVAMWSGFLFSSVNLVRGNGAIYFDSTASFLFLILGARHFLRRIQQKFLNPPTTANLLGPDHYVRLQSSGRELVSSTQLVVHDQLLLTGGQICPADCTILSDGATVDVSVLNGEPLPRRYEKGMLVTSGAKIVSDEVQVRVENRPADSYLERTLAEVKKGMWRKSQFVTTSARWAQRLVAGVFIAAILCFLYFLDQDAQEAFNRSLALLVLACPCALALGTPLAISLALKKAQAKGILIKNADALEKVLGLQNIFFDKTGTLTEPELRLVTWHPTEISEEMKTILISLESRSYHPVAFALRKLWSETPSVPVTNPVDLPGRGVAGLIGAHYYEFGQTSEPNETNFLKLVLKKDGVPLCFLNFENSVRPEAKECIRVLRERGLYVGVLSGDAEARVREVSLACDIPSANAGALLSAEQKRVIVAQHSRTCMIGDGTNDALSLQAADVGIAIKGSTPLNLEAADICFTRGGLTPLIELLDLARYARRVLIRNLSISLIYNLVGAVLAIGGYVSPLMAAILMPLSSFLILTSTLWGLR
jgi:Cu2+-exporting ATPase/Cu+-exporting ATPase